jgi:citrate lyase beta subunit
MGDDVITEAIEAAKAFLQAEKEGRGAIMIKGKMSDRATDRIYRVALKTAYALGRLDEATAKELHLV